METYSCDYVSQWYVNGGAWSDPNGTCFLGTQSNNYHAVRIEFKTKAMVCNSDEITFSLAIAPGTTSSLSLWYAISSSELYKDRYINTLNAVSSTSDPSQLTSGNISINEIPSPYGYKTINIKTTVLSSSAGTYYLYLWPATSSGYAVIQPKANVSHTITMTADHKKANGGTQSAHEICSKCKTVLSTAHSYTKTTQTPATCTTNGTTKYSCGCGYTYTAQDIPAKGHSYTSKVTSPTCTEQGYTTHTCSVCSNSYKDTYTNAKGHSYTHTVKNPTCTEKGYTTHTCSVCKHTYTDSEKAATGHSHSYSMTQTPTTNATGALTGICPNCSDKQTVTLPKLNKTDYDYKLLEDATYTDNGKEQYTWKITTYGEFVIVVIIPQKEGGLVYIYDGTEFIAYQAYIYNGSDWDLYIPYIYNGSDWDICC